MAIDYAGLGRQPRNRADPAPPFPWPEPYRAAMLLSFDVDAESAWTGDDPRHADLLVTMSYGGYEARVGTPRLLDLLAQLGLTATFFIPGWTVDAHPALCEAILRAGHEIGHHGYHHLLPLPGSPSVVEEVDMGLEALKRVLGVVPKGYRAPNGEFSEELLVLLSDRGIVYTSSFRDDVRPYRHRLPDGRPGTIELPVTVGFDDWLLGLQARLSPRQVLTGPEVLSIWTDELDEVRDWGAMVTTVLHPACSGRPMRLRLLRTFLRYAQECGDVWIARGEQIADRFAAFESPAGPQAQRPATGE
jgi:peptidoglycan-N-acetylglucosamine deacetylase